MWRRLVALIVGAFYVGWVVYGSLSLLKPPKPPRLPRAMVVHAPLTHHLLFVIVDGLRYDVAVDAERMPAFSSAMRRHRSSDILAGPVSMTSSAIISFATGQRGRLEQVVRNLNPDPPPFESWMENATERGLKVALVGDPTWIEMFGRGFSEVRPDPPGVAIDYDFNAQTFRDGREILAHAPNAMILHFVTPDHQGHAYGVQSERYRKHIAQFDSLLRDLLAEVGPEWTVVVTSDHGANDAGDHGGDVLMHRRSPIFAYGPGIAPPDGKAQTLDQVDVAGTISGLLGIPAPCHSQGHLLVNWLALSNGDRAELAYNDVERALTFARVLAPNAAGELERRLHAARARFNSEPAQLVVEARAIADDADQVLRAQQGVFSPRAWWLLASISTGAALLAWVLSRPIPAVTGVAATAVAAVSVALTAFAERLPGTWPTILVGVAFTVLNVPTLLLLLSPKHFLGWMEACKAYTPALVPGILAVTYPRNLQPESCVVLAIVPLAIVGSASLQKWGISGLRATRHGRALDLTLLALWVASLISAGWYGEGFLELAVSHHEHLVLALAVAEIGLTAIELARRAPEEIRLLAGLSGLAILSLMLRRVVPAELGRGLLVLVPLLAIWPLLWGRVELSMMCLLTGYTWVSRDMELISLAAAVGLASLVARRAASSVNRPLRLTLLAFWFSLAFALRVGVNGGIDLTHLDLGAGAFRDPAVPLWWVAFSLIWKNLLAFTLLGLAVLSAFPAREAARLAVGFAVISACRAPILLAMMQFSRGSYWTAMRVVSELPFTLIFLLGSGLSWLAYQNQNVLRVRRSALANE